MWCKKYKKKIKVQDCENCITKRQCSKICWLRGFVWGFPDDHEPVFEYSERKAEQILKKIGEKWQIPK